MTKREMVVQSEYFIGRATVERLLAWTRSKRLIGRLAIVLAVAAIA